MAIHPLISRSQSDKKILSGISNVLYICTRGDLGATRLKGRVVLYLLAREPVEVDRDSVEVVGEEEKHGWEGIGRVGEDKGDGDGRWGTGKEVGMVGDAKGEDWATTSLPCVGRKQLLYYLCSLWL